MEVTIRRTEPVGAIIERIHAQYGDLDGAERALATDPAAMEAVYWFKELAKDPAIVNETATTTSLVDVDPANLPKLTTARQNLLKKVRGMKHATIQDVVKASGRNYKNVHDDITVLEALGFIQSHRHGKERIVEAFDAELVIAA
jgi:hypothetical protein